MSPITTHVLDLSRGKPAGDLGVTLIFRPDGEGARTIAARRTDENGRIMDLVPASTPIESGIYRLRFDTGEYFEGRGEDPFYPYTEITFSVRDPAKHYHVPLLISGHGYTTYRGS